MTMKDRKVWGVVLGCGVIIVVVVIYISAFARVETTSLCRVCHMIYYDDAEYAYNIKPGPKPRGLLAGCADCHRDLFREYKDSDHSATDEDLRPGCANCHPPHRLITAAGHMFTTSPILSVTKGMMIGSLKWQEQARPRLAMKVRERLFERREQEMQGVSRG